MVQWLPLNLVRLEEGCRAGHSRSGWITVCDGRQDHEGVVRERQTFLGPGCLPGSSSCEIGKHLTRPRRQTIDHLLACYVRYSPITKDLSENEPIVLLRGKRLVTSPLVLDSQIYSIIDTLRERDTSGWAEICPVLCWIRSSHQNSNRWRSSRSLASSFASSPNSSPRSRQSSMSRTLTIGDLEMRCCLPFPLAPKIQSSDSATRASSKEGLDQMQ